MDFSSLGTTIKSRRLKLGLSLSDLSEATGVSKAMLSQIERSESIPTLTTLWKISDGLQIRFDTLIAESLGIANKRYNVTCLKDITPVTDDGGRILIYCTSPFSPISGTETFYCVMKPGCCFSSEGHRSGKIEHIFVFQGAINILVGKQAESYYLDAGSALSFDAFEKHVYQNAGEEDALIYIALIHE